jgi:hypothetical protein
MTYANESEPEHMPFETKRLLSLSAVALILSVLVYGYWVWPTPWQYDTRSAAEIQAEQSVIGGVMVIGSETVTQYRTSRINGRVEARWGGRWHPIVCGIDSCFPEKAP